MTANAIDMANRAESDDQRKQAQARASLLTPIAKAFSTDIGNEVASLGVQVHGGMGFIEETGAAQHMRDIRIAAIYEGTNGIQAIDLVTRKLTMEDGAVMAREIADMRETVRQAASSNEPDFGRMADKLRDTLDALERASAWLLKTLPQSPAQAMAGATSYLRLFAMARGGTALANLAIAARGGQARHGSHIAIARFFAENVCNGAPALEDAICQGADSSLALGHEFLEGA